MCLSGSFGDCPFRRRCQSLRNSQDPEPARQRRLLIRTTWTFRSSSGRCAPSRHQAEGHHQVLIVAPSPTLPIDAAIPSSVPAVFTAVGGVPGVDLHPGAPSTFRFGAQNRDEPPQRRQLCFAITVGFAEPSASPLPSSLRAHAACPDRAGVSSPVVAMKSSMRRATVSGRSVGG